MSSTIEELYERLATNASLDGRFGAIRVAASYEPGAGPGTKVSPPTYPTDAGHPDPYVVEDRLGPDGSKHRCVLLDSRQSEANRCEEALQHAIDAGDLALPHLVLDITTHGTTITMTSLTAPHRSRDAYFRDALDGGGTRFDDTVAGQELMTGAARAFYTYTPADLVYGVWDSHRQRRIQIKFPRVYTSEVVGVGAEIGTRMAGRYDLLTGAAEVTGEGADWELAKDGAKGGKRVSKIGLGPIPPQAGPGGVTVETIRREATLSFAGLARLSLGDATADRAGRAVLAALALLGDRLAFARSAIFLRSGCDLLLIQERLSWVGLGGEEPFELSPDDATGLFRLAVERARAAGLGWEMEPIRLRPMDKLQTLIDRVFLTAPQEGE